MDSTDTTKLTATTVAASPSPLVLGRNGEWWDGALLLSLAATALAAAIVFAATGGSVIAHKRETEASDRELEKYKAETERKVTDARQEGIVAGKTAGDALVRAAELEKDAAKSRERIAELENDAAHLSADAEASKAEIAKANARAAEATQKANEADVARLKLEAELAPRVITPAQQKELTDKLKPFAGTVIHIWVFPAGTPADAAPLSNVIRAVLRQAGWSTAMFISLGGQTNPGIAVASKANTQSFPAAAELVASLGDANINADMFQPYETEPEFGASTSPEDNAKGDPTVIIKIGAKR